MFINLKAFFLKKKFLNEGIDAVKIKLGKA